MSNKNISRKVTKILRHKLNTIKHNDEGFVLVNDLIKKIPELNINNIKRNCKNR